ncbi:JAB domain-containing protein [Chryseobacterium culicis]|uniref:JAB domain-containing protein n=1 Tax=Chryseobacterium culicis TaxID=680127 RepID=UPI001D0BEDBF|nr:JAB domain-containing protein [Chryseobacterium culicis]
MREKQVSAAHGAIQMKFNIVNEIKLSYSRKGNCERSISSSMDAVEVFRAHFDAEEMDYRESFFALYLNQANKVLGIKKISECGISSTLVDVRIVMQAALLCNASAIIVAHNHPSGNLKPSSSDIKMTSQIKEAAKILSLTLLDHVILTSDAHFSFADEGMM